ncbi:helix-turn-helix domain-containing protein [Streptomyces pinistramenti]|uniref:helix-turn-helix domain-containing protein n=1 Tax=Streptomyces pinistramenti TaxID=2884812 RepID=UPI001D08E76D|nr:Scr1 family TA system antitoxin-like transcriptional regulator [Streptomyces pinistramenti]MCB5907644.1 helix-turn-helix transcriptional regulator [Streptomyces pinistramenti]
MEDPRRVFAEECRNDRELYPERRLNQTQLAKMARVSKSTISRVEAGTSPIPPELPALLDQVFKTDGKYKRLYADITAQSFAMHSRRRIELEPKALSITEWSPTVVPGLLQTPGYARAVLRGGNPRASEKELAEKVNSRIARQRILEGSAPPDFSVVLCESVIRRTVGGNEVMREQLAALLAQGSRPTIVLQVLPLDAGAHGLVDGSMSILTTTEGPPIAYAEGVRSGAVIEESAELRQLSWFYNVLTASALSRDASAQMIRKSMEAL